MDPCAFYVFGVMVVKSISTAKFFREPLDTKSIKRKQVQMNDDIEAIMRRTKDLSSGNNRIILTILKSHPIFNILRKPRLIS